MLVEVSSILKTHANWMSELESQSLILEVRGPPRVHKATSELAGVHEDAEGCHAVFNTAQWVLAL